VTGFIVTSPVVHPCSLRTAISRVSAVAFESVQESVTFLDSPPASVTLWLSTTSPSKSSSSIVWVACVERSFVTSAVTGTGTSSQTGSSTPVISTLTSSAGVCEPSVPTRP
jgi:hypothetical protein